MNKNALRIMALIASGLALRVGSMQAKETPRNTRATQDASEGVNHRYYYLDSWMGAIGLPDDPFTTSSQENSQSNMETIVRKLFR